MPNAPHWLKKQTFTTKLPETHVLTGEFGKKMATSHMTWAGHMTGGMSGNWNFFSFGSFTRIIVIFSGKMHLWNQSILVK